MQILVRKFSSSRFAVAEDGATSVEYTLIIAMVALGIIGTLDDIAPALVAILNSAAALLNAV